MQPFDALTDRLKSSAVSFEGPVQTKRTPSSATGVKKHLSILWKPFSGNVSHLFNEKLVPILDHESFEAATKLIFTNQYRNETNALEGILILDKEVKIDPFDASKKRLKIYFKSPDAMFFDKHLFSDERSFYNWAEKTKNNDLVKEAEFV